MNEYLCEYCNDAISEGRVGVVELDGKTNYLHVDNERLSIGLISNQKIRGPCSKLYVMERSLALSIACIPLTKLERVV